MDAPNRREVVAAQHPHRAVAAIRHKDAVDERDIGDALRLGQTGDLQLVEAFSVDELAGRGSILYCAEAKRPLVKYGYKQGEPSSWREPGSSTGLSEYRGGPSAPRLLAALDALGNRHATTLVPPPSRNGVLVAARRPFRDHHAVDTGLPEPYRMVSVEFATFRLLGIYMPNLLAKIPYWEALIADLSSQSANRALAIGDFSTCRAYLDEAGAIDASAHYMDAIEQIGFRDLWRHRYPDRLE